VADAGCSATSIWLDAAVDLKPSKKTLNENQTFNPNLIFDGFFVG
jgi:hypothetical protein